jgi:hypothetical protein
MRIPLDAARSCTVRWIVRLACLKLTCQCLRRLVEIVGRQALPLVSSTLLCAKRTVPNSCASVSSRSWVCDSTSLQALADEVVCRCGHALSHMRAMITAGDPSHWQRAEETPLHRLLPCSNALESFIAQADHVAKNSDQGHASHYRHSCRDGVEDTASSRPGHHDRQRLLTLT